jgi:hypothetical protein
MSDALAFDLRLRLDAAGPGGHVMSSRAWQIFPAIVCISLPAWAQNDPFATAARGRQW